VTPAVRELATDGFPVSVTRRGLNPAGDGPPGALRLALHIWRTRVQPDLRLAWGVQIGHQRAPGKRGQGSPFGVDVGHLMAMAGSTRGSRCSSATPVPPQANVLPPRPAPRPRKPLTHQPRRRRVGAVSPPDRAGLPRPARRVAARQPVPPRARGRWRPGRCSSARSRSPLPRRGRGPGGTVTPDAQRASSC
jgi:hypothetical protein